MLNEKAKDNKLVFLTDIVKMMKKLFLTTMDTLKNIRVKDFIEMLKFTSERAEGII